jgi:hypothetical protein
MLLLRIGLASTSISAAGCPYVSNPKTSVM